MGEVTDYLDSLDGQDRAVLGRIMEIARGLAPEATEGRSYGMPALLLHGKGYVSALATKKHLALYPFSGQILPRLADELEGLDWAPGTLRFTAKDPVPEDLVRRILEARIAEIGPPRGRPG
ncbi:iron chaperone [Sinomonas mesophila]|uniref:iron chaperone n=1 Tax=Sinomonas mesophila TaxID=1531955 RepID=UPI00098729E0|nr:DUF1801 domain-containing protein [Sinomonas mesophila]